MSVGGFTNISRKHTHDTNKKTYLGDQAGRTWGLNDELLNDLYTGSKQAGSEANAMYGGNDYRPVFRGMPSPEKTPDGTPIARWPTGTIGRYQGNAGGPQPDQPLTFSARRRQQLMAGG